jgi:outer membrane protein assembly factor BamD
VLGCATAGSSRDSGTPEADFAAAKREFDEGHYFDAVLRLGEFIERHPGSVLVDQAIYLRGRAHQAQKDWALAAADFERLVQDFPESRNACDAEFALGECYWNQSRKWPYEQNETRRAIEQFKRYLSRCPEHPRRGEAESLIARARDRLAEKEFHAAELYYRHEEYEAALIYCDVVATDFADTRWACDARRLKAELLVELRRHEEARTEIQWLREHCASARGVAETVGRLESRIGKGVIRERRTSAAGGDSAAGDSASAAAGDSAAAGGDDGN